MIVHRLFTHPEVIPTLADLYLSEWEPYYGEAGPGDALADLEARCNCDALPIGMVAMEKGIVFGTVALDIDVTTRLTPSVVGLLVAPDHRERGVATALIGACEDLARELGHHRLYMSTTMLGHLLDRMAWQKTATTKFLNKEEGTVYAHDL